MTINVNQQQQNIPEDTTVTVLLDQLDMMTKGIAVAINDRVVPKQQWEVTLMKANDSVTIIQATQGG